MSMSSRPRSARVARAVDEFSQRIQCGQLGGIRRVGEAARPESIAERVRDVVLAHDGADLVEDLVHRILLAVVDHPFPEQGSAARNDSRHPGTDQRKVFPKKSGVDREVVDPLLRLALDLGQDHVVGQLLDRAAQYHAVDRHRADGDGAVVDDRLSASLEISAGR